MTIRLRGHHLLCMLTYQGEGYSPAFVANFDAIIKRISAGEAIEMIEGPDDICVCLLSEKNDAHCLNESVMARDTLALEQIEDEGLHFRRGTFVLTAQALAKLRQAFAQKRIRAACEGCEWHGLCTQIAENGFQGVRLTRERDIQSK
jgi:hypothetical protein